MKQIKWLVLSLGLVSMTACESRTENAIGLTLAVPRSAGWAGPDFVGIVTDDPPGFDAGLDESDGEGDTQPLKHG